MRYDLGRTTTRLCLLIGSSHRRASISWGGFVALSLLLCYRYEAEVSFDGVVVVRLVRVFRRHRRRYPPPPPRPPPYPSPVLAAAAAAAAAVAAATVAGVWLLCPRQFRGLTRTSLVLRILKRKVSTHGRTLPGSPRPGNLSTGKSSATVASTWGRSKRSVSTWTTP